MKIILDKDCECKIALSVSDNQWITLPKSSSLCENLNSKKCYDQELELLKGEIFSEDGNDSRYIPQVIYGQTKICELVPYSFPVYDRGDVELDGSLVLWLKVEDNKIVVEKNGAGELLICFADKDGNCLAKLNSVHGRKILWNM